MKKVKYILNIFTFFLVLFWGLPFEGYEYSKFEYFHIFDNTIVYAEAWIQVSQYTNREDHTETVLNNGKVLVVGGGKTSYSKTAEIFDQNTNQWTRVGDMSTGRQHHTATLLGNGKVLVTGGANSTASSVFNTCEIFDPNTNMWTSAGNLLSKRYDHTATLLSNGKVLVTGGYNGSSKLKSSELYDPLTNKWTSANNMISARQNHTATLLNNGKLLVAGTGAAGDSEIYNPSLNTWTSVGNMSVRRARHTATLLSNGKVLVTGGVYTINYYKTSEIFDPSTNTWSSIAYMSDRRSQHTATLLNDGKVLITGGKYIDNDDNTKIFKTCEMYDPSTNTWRIVSSMITEKISHTASYLGNGKVMVLGNDICELYDSSTNTWTRIGTMTRGREEHTATVLSNGKILVVGGADSNYSYYELKTCELYDVNTNMWTSAADMIKSRTRHTATLLNNGKVLVTGGTNNLSDVTTSCEIYDPITNTWTSAQSMLHERENHTATLLPNGKVLVTGGNKEDVTGDYGDNEIRYCEIYDPNTNTWTSAANMIDKRKDHTATLLNNGKVLVSGGSGLTSLSTCEIYDPTSNTWTSVGTMAQKRTKHSAMLLNNGKVIAFMGANESLLLKTCEIFDPNTNTWSFAGNTLTGRIDHNALMLSNGKILVTGGENGTYLSSSEIYNPNTNIWLSAGNMTSVRSKHTAVLMSGGRAVIIGGTNSSGENNTADLYKYEAFLPIPTLTAIPTTLTNSNVTVMITYSPDSTTKQYRINGGAWQSYTSPLTISTNCIVEAQASNAYITSGISKLDITNIDKTPPVTPTLSANITTPTARGVEITANYPADASVKQFRIGIGGTWTNYTAPVSVYYNGTVYAKCQDAAGNWSGEGSHTVSNIVTANAPVLGQGMIPIKWNGSSWIDTTPLDTQWYDYSFGVNKWANIRLVDGSMFVWIPRYTYKILSGEHTSTAGIIDIRYSNGTTDDTSGNYRKHPAFTFGTDELTGIWIAKFEASNDGTAKVQVKPGEWSWSSGVNDALYHCRAMQTMNSTKYGISSDVNIMDTHLMKNSEWAAVAYLAHSARAGAEVAPGTNVYTGGGIGLAYATNNSQSTTNNIYGIYDMSGLRDEYVAAYVNDGYHVTYGGYIDTLDAKYKDVFPIGANQNSESPNYYASASMYGQAIYETSTFIGERGTWNHGWSQMPYEKVAWFLRGGRNTHPTAASIFAFSYSNGDYDVSFGFRPSLVVMAQKPTIPTLSATPTTPTNGNVSVTINYSSDSTIKQYRIDGGIWQNYIAPLTITKNCLIEAQASNLNGTSSIGKLQITNIDKTAPNTPILSENTTTPTGSGVEITITYPADATTKQYKIGTSGMWTNYTNPITLYYNGTIYGKCSDAAGNWSAEGKLTVSNIVTANAPELGSGMIPIKWNGSAWVDTTKSDIEWYDYSDSMDKWANIRLADGSMFVWIPRYTYKIISGEHTSTAGSIDIRFSNETIDDTSAEYRQHPAFDFGGTQLLGIWVGKFETSNDGAGMIQVKPGVSSWRNITVDDIFNKSREMQTKNSAKYGIRNDSETHMLKNSEWGATAYLAHWARGGTEVGISRNLDYNYYTGGGSGTAYELNISQSTTNNIYGIYDLNGGSQEYVAAYIINSWAYNQARYLYDAPLKYKDEFRASGDTSKGNYLAALDKYGHAIYETSYSYYGSTSWLGDMSSMPNDTAPCFIRGGRGNQDSDAGIFAFNIYSGYAHPNTSFRVAVSVIYQPPETPIMSQTPTTPTNGDVTITVNYSSDSTTKQYRINGGIWQSYTAPLIISENCIIDALASNSVGTSELGTLHVTNIDRIPPTAPTISINPATVTNGNVTVTINYSADAVVKCYNINGGTSNIYTGVFTVNNNCTVNAGSKDDAGNWSAESRYIINNIDITSPTGTLIINDGASKTYNKKVRLYIEGHDNEPIGSGIVEVVVSENALSTSWEEYNSQYREFTLSLGEGDKIVWLKFKDAAGNISSPVSDSIEYEEPVSLFDGIQHNQIINVAGTEVVFTGPDSLAVGETMPEGQPKDDWNKFTDGDYLKYKIILDINDVEKSKQIQDLKIELHLKDIGQDGISIEIDKIALKKNNTIIKDLKPNLVKLNSNGTCRYDIVLGKDTDDKSIIPKYGVGQYIIEYSGRLRIRTNNSDDVLNITNDAVFKVYTGASNIPDITEPDKPTNKTSIVTRILRKSVLVR